MESYCVTSDECDVSITQDGTQSAQITSYTLLWAPRKLGLQLVHPYLFENIHRLFFTRTSPFSLCLCSCKKNHSHITMTQSSNDSRTDFLEDLVPVSRWPVVAQTNSRRGSNNTKCGNISARLLSRLPLGQRRRNIVSDWPKGGAAPQRVGHSPLLIPILVIWYFSE